MSRVNRNGFREAILVIPSRSRRIEVTVAEARSELSGTVVCVALTPVCHPVTLRAA